MTATRKEIEVARDNFRKTSFDYESALWFSNQENINRTNLARLIAKDKLYYLLKK